MNHIPTEVERVGGTTTLRVDVLIIASTNKDLLRSVREGSFRDDLYFRLNVITVDLPALKQRKEEIPLLVASFLGSKMKTKVKKSISPRAMEVLMQYDWPGNIRELENVIERAAILCQDNTIEPHDLSLATSSMSLPAADARRRSSGPPSL